MNKSSRLRLKIKEAILSQHQPENTMQADKNSLDLQKLEMEIDRVKQHMGERKLHTKLIYRFIYLWCVAVAVLLLGCGIGKIRLSDLVLSTIVGCTTLNVFGVFYLVMRFLFNKNKSV